MKLFRGFPFVLLLLIAIAPMTAKSQAPAPCSLGLDQAPAVRGFSFGTSFLKIKQRFENSNVAVTLLSMDVDGTQNPLIQKFKLELDRREGVKKAEADKTFEGISEIQLFFEDQGATQTLFGYTVIYNEDVKFDGINAVKKTYFNSFNIPPSSWIPDADFSKSKTDWTVTCDGWNASIWLPLNGKLLIFHVANREVVTKLKTLREQELERKRIKIPFSL